MPVARWRPDRRERHEFAVRTMERQQGIEIDVGQPVTPRDHEGAVAHMRNQPLDSTAGHRVVAGVDQVDIPIGCVGFLERCHVARRHVDRQRSVDRCRLDHVPLDHLAFVSERNRELRVAVVRVQPHDVPQDRFAPDFDEGLGAHLRLFGEARAFATSQNSNLHLQPFACAHTDTCDLQHQVRGTHP